MSSYREIDLPVKCQKFTRAELIETLKLRTAEILHTSPRQYIYPDTVEILFEQKPLTTDWEELKRVANDELRLKKSKCGLYKTRLRRPSLRVISLIEELWPGHKVSRVDFALDFITATLEEAKNIGHILEMHLTMPWRRNREYTNHKGTIYYAEAWKRRTIVIYSNRPSKITKEPTTHLEFRWFGVPVCKEIGIRAISHIVDFNPIPAMISQSRFSILNWTRVIKLLDNLAGSLMLSSQRIPGGSGIVKKQLLEFKDTSRGCFKPKRKLIHFFR